MFEMWMNILGFSLCNWINYGLSFAGGAVAWRFPIAFQFVFIFCLYATVPWLPESPRWLLYHEKDDDALVIVAALESKEIDDAAVIAKQNEIRYSVQYEKSHKIRWRDLLRPQPEATKPLRRLILGAGTQFIQQFEGINIMSYYLPTVLISAVGLSNEMARLLTAINSVVYLIFTAASIPLVEKWGRRGLMMLSTAGQGLSFLAITVLLRYGSPPDGDKQAAKASIAFFFLFFISFGLGMLGVPWLYPTEINSIAMRTKGAAVATASNWFVRCEARLRAYANLSIGLPILLLWKLRQLVSRILAGNFGSSLLCLMLLLCRSFTSFTQRLVSAWHLLTKVALTI